MLFNRKRKAASHFFKIDDSIRKDQMEKLATLRANRDNEAVKKLLTDLHESAVNGKNIMPVTISAVETM